MNKLEIPSNYPKGHSDEDIRKIIDDCAIEVSSPSKPGKLTTTGSSYYASIIQLGQTELNQRIQEKSNKSNKMLSIISIALGIITILLAITSIYYGQKQVYFAQTDQTSDHDWRNSQIELLERNIEELEKANILLLKLNQELSELEGN